MILSAAHTTPPTKLPVPLPKERSASIFLAARSKKPDLPERSVCGVSESVRQTGSRVLSIIHSGSQARYSPPLAKHSDVFTLKPGDLIPLNFTTVFRTTALP